MSKTTKRKHVMKEILTDDYELPKDNQSVVKILSSKGNNLHEVESKPGEVYLVSMPTKFRKNIWVKRGDYVLVEPILEGVKVKAEIVKILDNDLVKYYKSNSAWPAHFQENKKKQEDEEDLFVNTNRVTMSNYSEDSSEETCSDSDNENYKT